MTEKFPTTEQSLLPTGGGVENQGTLWRSVSSVARTRARALSTGTAVYSSVSNLPLKLNVVANVVDFALIVPAI